MQVEVFSPVKKEKSIMTVSEKLFSKAFNEALVHQVVVSSLSNHRQGTHRQKNRAEVSGGGKKPWNQKGSGRARAGTIRSPIWRHGGVAFAATLGVYGKKINKKMYWGAVHSIFSQLFREKRLIVVDQIELNQPKTKLLSLMLAELNAKKPLIIVDQIENNLALSARNLANTALMNVNVIDPSVLLSHETIIMTKSAVVLLDEALQ